MGNQWSQIFGPSNLFCGKLAQHQAQFHQSTNKSMSAVNGEKTLQLLKQFR
jgi:hypothetical protein